MDIKQKIHETVTGNPVVLYMKGTPQAPQCGFSARAIQILQACGVKNLVAVDVLADPDVRQGVKGLRQLADRATALYRRRVCRRQRHHDRDVPVGRIAEAAGTDRQRGLI
jgi:hypothetical protein